ncbi:MAG: hypothetical protein PHX51_04580 [Clostridia bacterium]|nr:hypothetical protein [Clostridia bacterium]
MNIIWVGLFILSLICFMINGDASSLGVMIGSGKEAVLFSLELTAVYALWMGFIEISTQSGLLENMSGRIKPLIDKLFKNSCDKAREFLALNLTANLLGLTNAATPSAISAVKELDKENKTPYPTYAMCMLFVINATGIDFFPATVIALRSAYGSADPTSIFLPFVIVNLINSLVGVLLVYLLCSPRKQKSSDCVFEALTEGTIKRSSSHR